MLPLKVIGPELFLYNVNEEKRLSCIWRSVGVSLIDCGIDSSHTMQPSPPISGLQKAPCPLAPRAAALAVGIAWTVKEAAALQGRPIYFLFQGCKWLSFFSHYKVNSIMSKLFLPMKRKWLDNYPSLSQCLWSTSTLCVNRKIDYSGKIGLI